MIPSTSLKFFPYLENHADSPTECFVVCILFFKLEFIWNYLLWNGMSQKELNCDSFLLWIRSPPNPFKITYKVFLGRIMHFLKKLLAPLIIIYFILFYFLAVLGLRFCARASSSCGKWGPLFIAVRGPLTIAASPVAEHRLQTRRLSSCGSRA